jgi:hypothetical protein
VAALVGCALASLAMVRAQRSSAARITASETVDVEFAGDAG